MPPKALSKVPNKTPKISEFFKKVNDAAIIEISDNEEVIHGTPEKKKRRPVLREVIKRSGPITSTQLSPTSNKKRGCYPDEIPDFEITMPQRKKPCTSKPGVKVVSLADISQEDFQKYHDSMNNSMKRETYSKTPDKIKSPRKTPNSGGKRGTPMKLFNKTPEKVKEFKVEILQNYIKVTPSKNGGNEWKSIKSPKTGKSLEKKQQSMLQFTTPSPSKKSHDSKLANEHTPINIPSTSNKTPTAKVKTKLDFSLSTTYTTVLRDDKAETVKEYISPRKSSVLPDDKAETVKENISPRKSPKFSPSKLACYFDDSWDPEIPATEKYDLKLDSPQRCKIIQITRMPEKLKVAVQSTVDEEEMAIVYLGGNWYHSNIVENCDINIQAHLKDNEWWVDNSDGYLVFEPDHLISCTTIVGSTFCKRKSILKECFGGYDPFNKVMVVGSLIHELFEESLKRNLNTEDDINAASKDILSHRSSIYQLYDSGLSLKEVKAEIQLFAPKILDFMQQYLAGKKVIGNRENWKGKIDEICDIEENIWCPTLGMKGKVDVSIRANDKILPLELKTGRASMSMEHQGQIALYIMMMNKFGYKVSSGLLLYLREGMLREITLNSNTKRDLMMLRNELAYYLTQQPKWNNRHDLTSKTDDICDIEDIKIPELPEPVNRRNACASCEYNTVCSAFLKKENCNFEDFPYLGELQPSIMGHLTDSHINYFTHWCNMLHMESNAGDRKLVKDIYSKSAKEREDIGKSLANMCVDGNVIESGGVFRTTFKRNSKFKGSTNIAKAGFVEGHYVVVSLSTRPAIATGFVSHLDMTSITIELDRDISKKYKNIHNLALDTYDSNLLASCFTNLSLMLENTERAERLRRLIIDKEIPIFKKTLGASTADLIKSSNLSTLNICQQTAVIKALATQDYLLIKGMPGTGKTATLVALIALLNEMNFSVLITSHTHSAIDNICLRLVKTIKDIKLLRLGASNRIDPGLIEYSESYLTSTCKTPEDLHKVYNNANIIAVTCLGSKHSLFSKRTMDFCIVDESTQVLQPSVIRALYACKTFILVGDPDQLPPIIINKVAQRYGMAESLFERLHIHNDAVVTLRLNYRMNRTITQLANNLTYLGKLLAASNKVADATLHVPLIEHMRDAYKDNEWIFSVLDSDLKKAVAVVDTGPVWNRTCDMDWLVKQRDAKENSRCVNPSECVVVVTLVNALLRGGVASSNIGVIAPYKAQVVQLASMLKFQEVEVNTVDQFQGKDKEIIFYSSTISRDISEFKKLSKYNILQDQRRLTVAITRAKHKLVLVSDVATVREYSPFEKLFNAINHEHRIELINGKDGFYWDKLLNHRY